jgi:hypothetical protein
MTVPGLAQQSRPFEFSLRIRHPDMDPVEISRTLGLEPVHAFKAGERRAPRSNLSAPLVYSESYWLATLEALSVTAAQTAQTAPTGSPLSRVEAAFDQERSQVGTLDLALNVVLMGFARRHEPFLRRVQLEGGQVTLLIAVTSAVRGFTITSEMSRMLEKTGIAVEFEFGES